MLRATLVGWASLAISLGAVFTIASVVKTPRQPGVVKLVLGAAGLLLLVHPGIWLGTTSGDCGMVRFVASIGFALTHVALAVPAVLLSRKP
jgi:hypothetical protein